MRSAVIAPAVLLLSSALHAQFAAVTGSLSAERGLANQAFDPHQFTSENVGRPFVPIELRVVCDGRIITAAQLGSLGEFRLRLHTSPRWTMSAWRKCEAYAYLPGFRSDILKVEFPTLGRIVLHRQEGNSGRILSAPSLLVSADSRRLFDIALTLPGRNETAQARQDLQHLTNDNPQYAQAWYQLGVLQMSGEPDAARASFQKAIAADPAYVFPYQQLMRLNTLDRKWDQVVSTATQLLKLCPHDYPEGWYDLAFASDQLGHREDAKASALHGLEEDPHHTQPELHRLLGMMLIADGDRSAGERHLREYLQWCPDALDAAYIESILPPGIRSRRVRHKRDTRRSRGDRSQRLERSSFRRAGRPRHPQCQTRRAPGRSHH